MRKRVGLIEFGRMEFGRLKSLQQEHEHVLQFQELLRTLRSSDDFNRWAGEMPIATNKFVTTDRVAYRQLDSIILNMSEPRLLKWQYDELNAQYGNTPSIAEGTGEGGQHWISMNLLNRFGLHPNSRDQAMELAEELLAQGWRDDVQELA